MQNLQKFYLQLLGHCKAVHGDTHASAKSTTLIASTTTLNNSTVIPQTHTVWYDTEPLSAPPGTTPLLQQL